MPQSDKQGASSSRSEAQGGEFGAMAYVVRSMLSQIGTADLVKVVSVSASGALAPVGFCSIQPLVAQVDGEGRAFPHGTIHNVPYFRLQGGTNAVIMDPAPGDIGVAVFARRDISSAKAARGPAPPGSRRQFDMADALYIGGVLNGAPTQFIRFSADGVEVVSPTKIRHVAPEHEFVGNVAFSGGTVTHNGSDIGQSHVHGGVEPGGGTSGPPA